MFVTKRTHQTKMAETTKQVNAANARVAALQKENERLRDALVTWQAATSRSWEKARVNAKTLDRLITDAAEGKLTLTDGANVS